MPTSSSKTQGDNLVSEGHPSVNEEHPYVCITGAMRTCPTAVLEVILDITPLHIVMVAVAHVAMYKLTRAGTGGDETLC
ncbi:hypothetical protein Trydic_g21607 [Trypoxylus dichotomus]